MDQAYDKQAVKKIAHTTISKMLDNWDDSDVRTVPGVMVQVRCGPDKTEPTVEYRIHWFFDCSETYIHNHQHSFHTFCLEGEYLEKQWQVIDDDGGVVTYQFERSQGNAFDAPKPLSGKLVHIGSRHHFSGNLMHLNTNQYHSINPVRNPNDRVLTFVIRQKQPSPPSVHVLSPVPTIEAPTDRIIAATEEERHAIEEKLRQMLAQWRDF